MGEGANLILVGVVHGDPDGYDKLLKLLEQTKPPLVSVEISKFSWRYRRRFQGRWQRQFQLASQALLPKERRHVAVQKVAAQISYPFEVKAAEEYAREHGAAWRAIDLNRISQEQLRRYETELLSSDNLRHLMLTKDGDWQDQIRQEYQRARKALQATRDQGMRRRGWVLPPQTRLREKVLAHRLARLVKVWSKVVHVGGWEHLIRSEGRDQTMIDFLEALRPKRLLLDGSRFQEA